MPLDWRQRLRAPEHCLEEVVGSEPGRGNEAEGSSGTVLDYARVEEKGNEFSRREWCKANFSLPDFNYINMLSYFDYQREKVFIRTSPVLKRSRLRKRKKRRTRPHVEEQVMLRSESCPY